MDTLSTGLTRLQSPPPRSRRGRAGAARAGWSPALVALVALVAPGAAGCAAPRVQLGGQCVFNDDCAAPLVCAGHFCRAECRTDRDCVSGWHCSPSGQLDKRVCLPPGTPAPCVYSSECPAPLICTRDGYCSPQCRTDVDCQLEDPASCCVPYTPPDSDAAVLTCSFHPVFDGGGGAGPTCRAGGDAGATE